MGEPNRLVSTDDHKLNWAPLRVDRFEQRNVKPGRLSPVLIPDNAPASYSLDLVYHARDALTTLRRAGSRMQYWVVDADLSAPLLVTRGLPDKRDAVALVAPRSDIPRPQTNDAVQVGSMENVSLDTAGVVGLDQWPVWYREPALGGGGTP